MAGGSERNQDVNSITSGPLAPSLLRFAFPLSIAMATNAIYVMTDMYWVGGLGVSSVAAVLSASILTMLSFSLQLGAQTGSTAFISRYFGAKQWAKARHSALQSMMLSLSMAIIVALLFYTFAHWLFAGAMGQTPEVSALGVQYLRPLALGMPLVFLQSQTATILQAVGEAQKTTAIFLLSALCNIVLDPILIEGWVGPAFGVAGAAYATILSRSAGLILGLILLRRRKGGVGKLELRLRPALPDSQFFAMFSIGIPRIIQFAFVPISRMLLIRLAMSLVLADDRDSVSAAFTLCLRLEFISFLPIFGLSRASQVFIGQNLGAKKQARAKRTGWVAAGLSAVYLMVVSVLFLTYPEQIMRPFLKVRGGPKVTSSNEHSGQAQAQKLAEKKLADQEKVVAYGVQYMGTVAWVITLWGVTLILNSAVNGAGDTVFPAIFTGMTLVPIRFGLAWWFSGYFGLIGIWYAVAATMALLGLVYIAYYSSGRWIRVSEHRMNIA
jgi:putative MATE family efflux protein